MFIILGFCLHFVCVWMCFVRIVVVWRAMAMGWDFVGALVQMERHHNAATISPTSNLGFKSTAIFRVFACFRCISVMVLQQLTIRHCRLQGINPATPCTLTGWVAFPPENAWIRIRQRRTAILTGVTELRSNDVHGKNWVHVQ